MKIGILCYRQYPYVSANTAIAYIIGECLAKKHEVAFIGRRQDQCQESICEFKGNKILFLNQKPIEGYSRLKNYLIRLGFNKIAFWSDASELRNLIRNEGIEALICVIAPIDDLYISMAAEIDIPIYIYQLDPFYNLNDMENVGLKRKFIQYIKQTSHVFTTQLLMEQYKLDYELHNYLGKISIAQFPKLIKPSKSYSSNSGKITLLYAGSLYADRKASYLIELSKCLPENSIIVFCGKCETKEDENYLKESGIKCRGYCSQEELAFEMDNASVYVNIGNVVKNQLPSKVIDYIGTGKPIINLSQIKDCSSKKVLKDYKYYLDVNVNEIEANKERILNFVLYSKDKTIPWTDIEKQYKEYTPEFVAGQILEQIENDYKRR